MSRLLQATCVKPNYSLRRQLLVSFGVTSVLAIAVVMIIATLTVKSSGSSVKSHSRSSLKRQVIKNLGTSTEVVALTVARKFDNFGSVASIIEEAARDRFVGYPGNFADDSRVPFRDMVTGRRVYPLRASAPRVEWNISGNVNSENFEEHVQERFSFYSLPLSTADAHYFMQGVCDPSETNPSAKTFYLGCTQENNNFTSGGVVQPTPTNGLLAEKGADLIPMLKPLYETHGDVKIMGVYFANSGAGSFVSYPAEVRDGTSTFTSIGCDWMTAINDLTGRPLGTDEEIARCHKAGDIVKSREYNPLERSWCRDQALNRGKTRSVGPYLDAFRENLWLVTFGRAVFDRETGEFLGCTLLDVSIARIEEILNGVKIGGNISETSLALIRWDDGTVLSSSQWDTTNATGTISLSDLDLGITHSQITSLVDFETEWSPEQINEAFLYNVFEHDGSLITVCPIPLPPAEYDETYLPDYIIVSAVDESILAVVDKTDAAIDDDVDELIWSTLIIGFVGLSVVLVIIWIFSIFLTRPLSWMERAAFRIVNIADSDSLETVEFDEDKEPLLRCMPKTEITHLVTEFRTMIHGFSGEGAAKVARAAVNEVKNTFEWRPEFQQFYSSGEDDETVSSSAEMYTSSMFQENAKPENPMKQKSGGDHTVPKRLNMGTNIPSTAEDTVRDEQTKFYFRALLNTHRNVFSSPLFWWIIVLIVLPLLVTMAAICTVVILDITTAQPTWLEDVSSSSMELEKEEIVTAATVRAHFTEQAMIEPVRDLHLFSRVVGWLLFGGLRRSSSFTELDEGTEECKFFPPNRTCPFFSDSLRAPCDCSWEDSYGIPCQDFGDRARFLQRGFWAGQSQDADPVTGSRIDISFNGTDFSPESTAWWTNVTDMPGSFKGESASGYETTYDRVRVLSAAAVAKFPIYNYFGGSFRRNHLGVFVGLDADGMLTGWNGCSYSNTGAAHFVSTKENGASSIGGDLCPLGKYGYDCRCRDWYAHGKRKGISNSGSGVHITPPYIFASKENVAASATSALIDPITGSHVGQALIDFIPTFKHNTIAESGSDFDMIITPETDALGGDTVVAPGYSLGGTAPPIGDVILPMDEMNSTNRRFFDRELVARMKAGGRGKMKFKRTRDDGREEVVFVAYAPVEVRTSRPIDPSVFMSGIFVAPTVVYSLGVAISESELKMPFTAVEDEVRREIDVAAITLIVLIVVVAILVSLVSYDVAVSITVPVIILLGIVRNINAKRIRDDIPPMEGGSREVNQVYNSFAKLHKVLRFSNTAFFSGNLQWAYKFLNDARKLFKELGDKKSIAIAANNLGNTMVAMYKEQYSGRGCCIIDSRCVWHIGRQCYDEAIKLGQEEYLKHPGSGTPESVLADYAEQLANRYFNRGLFFLLTRHDPCAVDDAVERGYEDLLKAKCLDREAQELRPDLSTTNGHNSEYFDKVLRRLQGLVGLLEDDGVMDVWEIKDMIDEAERILFIAWNSSAPMFKEVSRIGRLQQLEDIVVQYEIGMQNFGEAARIGMRMLVEDDFILELPFSSAAHALMMILRGASTESSPRFIDSWGPGTVSAITANLRRMSRRCKTTSLDTGKNLILCFDGSCRRSGNEMHRVPEHFVRIYDECCSEYDNVGIFLTGTKLPDDLLLQRKGHAETEQRSILTRICKCPGEMKGVEKSVGRENLDSPLQNALELAIKTRETGCSDTWIFAFLDGGAPDFLQDQKFKTLISDLNAKRASKINVIIIGVELNDSEIRVCKDFCMVSKESAYVDATSGLDSIEQAFEEAGRLLTVGATNWRLMYGGLTMEKF